LEEKDWKLVVEGRRTGGGEDVLYVGTGSRETYAYANCMILFCAEKFLGGGLGTSSSPEDMMYTVVVLEERSTVSRAADRPPRRIISPYPYDFFFGEDVAGSSHFSAAPFVVQDIR
jgi:hypothetical protein